MKSRWESTKAWFLHAFLLPEGGKLYEKSQIGKTQRNKKIKWWYTWVYKTEEIGQTESERRKKKAIEKKITED